MPASESRRSTASSTPSKLSSVRRLVLPDLGQAHAAAVNLDVRRRFESRVRATMTVWDALELLDTLVGESSRRSPAQLSLKPEADQSDPDTELGQIQHLLQTAEAIRKDGKPEWMQVTGLVHDLVGLASPRPMAWLTIPSAGQAPQLFPRRRRGRETVGRGRRRELLSPLDVAPG